MEEPMNDGMPPDLRLEIDVHKLDQEWQGHAEQAESWSRYAARCRFDLDDKKGELEVANIDQKRRAAEAYEEIRGDPESFFAGKPTEAAIANAVVLHPINKPQSAVEDARKVVMGARYSLDVAEGTVSALKDRKHALQALVELHLAGYLGGPKQRSAGETADHRQGRRGRQRGGDDNS